MEAHSSSTVSLGGGKESILGVLLGVFLGVFLGTGPCVGVSKRLRLPPTVTQPLAAAILPEALSLEHKYFIKI